MSIDGIWTSEILGMFGWETVGVLVFKDGKGMGGGNNHYSSGTFQEQDGKVNISMSVVFHGTPRTIFGSADPSFTVEGSLGFVDDRLEGTVKRVDIPEQTITYRLTRRADLP